MLDIPNTTGPHYYANRVNVEIGNVRFLSLELKS